MLQKVWRDFMACMHRQLFLFWLVKTSWNIVYIIGMPMRGYRMARFTHKHDLHAALQKRPAVIIRSSNDSWLTPDARTLLAAEHITHFDIPGQHDDCWFHTKEYAALIDTIIKDGARLKP